MEKCSFYKEKSSCFTTGVKTQPIGCDSGAELCPQLTRLQDRLVLLVDFITCCQKIKKCALLSPNDAESLIGYETGRILTF